jgi:hemerythrin-like metal-binding protein
MLSVGVPMIDEQHQKLIALMNELNEHALAEDGRDQLERSLKAMLDYTVFHFGAEEAFMEASGWVLTAEHKAEHQKFIVKATAFHEMFKTGKEDLSHEVLKFLRDWLSRHILGTDKKMAKALAGARADSGVA